MDTDREIGGRRRRKMSGRKKEWIGYWRRGRLEGGKMGARGNVGGGGRKTV